MSGAVLDNKVVEKHFWCPTCSHYWLTGSFDTLDPVDTDDKNYDNYTSKCQICGEIHYSVPHYYANISKMARNATGPRTPAGKERVSKNAIKHGLYSSPNQLLFPTKFGKYNECANCFQSDLCESHKITYCTAKTDLLLRVLAAYKSGNIDAMKEVAGLAQGKLLLILNDMFNDMQTHGLTMIAPKTTKDGDLVTDDEGNVIKVYSANPLLSHIPNIMSSLGFNAEQQSMTPSKSQDPSGVFDPGKSAEEGAIIMTKIMAFANQASTFTKAAEEARKQDPTYKVLNGEEIQEDDVKMNAPDFNPFPGK